MDDGSGADKNHIIRSALPARKAGLLAAVVASFLSVPAPSGAAVTLVDKDALEDAVTSRINTIRAANGLRKLTGATRLKTAGTKHVKNMALNGYFSHSWSSGATFTTWIRWFWPGPGYTSWSAGENLFWASPDATAREVVRAWMTSAGHRANILDRRWRQVGVGAVLANDAGGAYAGTGTAALVAAEFGRRS